MTTDTPTPAADADAGLLPMPQTERDALQAAWTDFLDANPDDITSPEKWPDHALITFDQMVGVVEAARFATTPPSPDSATLASLQARVAEVVEEGDGCWHACSGCQESVDGYVSERDYPYSPIFKCQPGAGCRECGGIGVLWQDGDFLSSYGDVLSDPEPSPDSAVREALIEALVVGTRLDISYDEAEQSVDEAFAAALTTPAGRGRGRMGMVDAAPTASPASERARSRLLRIADGEGYSTIYDPESYEDSVNAFREDLRRILADQALMRDADASGSGVRKFIEAEIRGYRHAQENAKSDTDKMYRMGQKDALILLLAGLSALNLAAPATQRPHVEGGR
jgi:hypothetical protein